MSHRASTIDNQSLDADVLDIQLEAAPPLTEKQASCLEYVLSYFGRYGYYPTQREIAEAMSLRSSTAEVYLSPLVQKGYLERKPRRHRNIKLTRAGLEKLRSMGVNVREQLRLNNRVR